MIQDSVKNNQVIISFFAIDFYKYSSHLVKYWNHVFAFSYKSFLWNYLL